MGTGQMLVTIGAVMLLGSIILTTNRGITGSGEVMLKTNFALEATSLAASTIDEAMYLPFDNATANSFGDGTTYIAINQTNLLTTPTLLGSENADDAVTPDDFDDYNGPAGGANQYRLQTVVDSTGIYMVKTRVCYVTKNDLNGKSNAQTWLKRLDVSVWNTASPLDTVKMSAIYAYWYFR
jgi:hypothetical protein